MIVRLNRYDSDSYGSIGDMRLASGKHCYVLERAATGIHPRIQLGNYKLGLKKIGTSHFDGVAKMFMGAAHRGMIEVLNVPGRTEILLHWGNSVKDSEGCLLVGDSYQKSNVGSGNADLTFWVSNSRDTYKRIYPDIADAILGGEDVSLAIVESFLLKPTTPPPLVA